MDEKKKKLILTLGIGILLCIIICIFIIQITNKKSDTIMPDEDGNIYELPAEVFDSTKDRDFNITLKNLKTKKYWEITKKTDFNDINYKFTVPEIPEGMEYLPMEPDTTACEVRFGENQYTDVFVFCTKNESKKDRYFKDNRLVYVSYRGNPDWELCGVTTNITKEQVIEILGEPTQAYLDNEGQCLEWYVLKDNHAYIINVNINLTTNKVWKISLNVDNHKVFN